MKKPRVALFDMLDNSEASLPWNLADEFSNDISTQITKIDKLFLVKQDEIAWQYPLQLEKLIPFRDHSWLQENHPNVEYIAFIELIEHDIVPRNPDQNLRSKTSFNLNISARLKVIDVRDDIPKVILQEIITQSHYIPWQFSSINYNKTRPGKTIYNMTPIGLAHGKLTQSISKRIEDYILLANTR
ncbi:MAG: hypothetical protein P0S95_01645 [Rhabdochlamydiaceae bacterium]|nr:hypothetical protein [Candidatus Amphrikana amoebophyrae]